MLVRQRSRGTFRVARFAALSALLMLSIVSALILPTRALARLSSDTMPRSGGSPGLSFKLLPSCLVHSSTHHQYFAAIVKGLRPKESIGFYIHPNALGVLGVRQATTRGVVYYRIVAPSVGTYIVSVYRILPRAATATLRVLSQGASCR
jgi:hypothetical protein